jgi:hypothetical protein
MARALRAEGVEVDVATTDDDGPGRRLPVGPGPVERDGFRVWHFPKQTEFYKVSLPLARWLNRRVREYDLMHIHTVFSFATVAAARAAQHRHRIRQVGVEHGVVLDHRGDAVIADHRRAELPEQREHIRAAFTLETNRQVAAMRETLSDQIAHLGHSLAADLSAFNEAAENRSEKLHRRIDPLVEQVAANHQAIRQHIDDERAVKAAAAHPHHPQPQHGGILNGN